jgi:hypothetical protein
METRLSPTSNFSNEIEFVHSHEEKFFHAKDLIQLFPLGLSFAQDLKKPFLLLRDEKNELTLPVALTPLEAGIFLAQNQTPLQGPHGFLERLIKSLGIELRQCVFVQIKSQIQLVRIYFTGHPALNSLDLKADEALSLCVHFKVPNYATREFIKKSSVMKAAPILKDQLLEPGTFFIEPSQKYLV